MSSGVLISRRQYIHRRAVGSILFPHLAQRVSEKRVLASIFFFIVTDSFSNVISYISLLELSVGERKKRATSKSCPPPDYRISIGTSVSTSMESSIYAPSGSTVSGPSAISISLLSWNLLLSNMTVYGPNQGDSILCHSKFLSAVLSFVFLLRCICMNPYIRYNHRNCRLLRIDEEMRRRA